MYGLFCKSREIPKGVVIIGEYFDGNMLGKYDPKDTHHTILFEANAVWNNSYAIIKNRYDGKIDYVDEKFKEFMLREYPEWTV